MSIGRPATLQVPGIIPVLCETEPDPVPVRHCPNPRCRQLTVRRTGYCRPCHAEYMRRSRPHYWELSELDRRKSICRAYSNMLQKRGVIQRKPCRSCGSEKAEKHHPSYANPRRVQWLCRRCHRALHRRAEHGRKAA